MSNGPMVSEVSICNQALGWLGQDLITSLSDLATTAELCRGNYMFLRDAVLETVMWTFATERAESSTSDKDPWNQAYRHAVPNDWLQVHRCFCNVDTKDPSDWVSAEWLRQGDYVLSDEPTLYMLGTKRVTDSGKFSALFAQALAARLAADLCIPLTSNRLLQRDMWALYGDKIAEAAASDGRQGKMERLRAKHLHNRR